VHAVVEEEVVCVAHVHMQAVHQLRAQLLAGAPLRSVDQIEAQVELSTGVPR
jgi:hypothetical protein